MTNIIYILPYEKKPTGGINVVLQHSELINKINNKFKSQIIFIKKKKTSKWKQSFNKFILCFISLEPSIVIGSL